MEKAYKGMMGGYSVLKEDDEKHSCTHIVLTVDEYNKLLEKNESLKSDLLKEKKARKTEVEKRNRIKSESIEYKKNADEEAQEKIDEMMQKVIAAQQEKDYQENLNINLLRINRERSNAERKVQNKKTHSGYIVLQSQEKEVRYAVKKGTDSMLVWETTIQSLYSVDFTEKQARTQINRDLTPENGKWMLAKLGIGKTFYTSLSEVLKSENINEENIAFQMRLRANFKTGYWEVIYMHTKPLDVVPEEMK